MKLTRATQIIETLNRDYAICFSSKEGKAVLADLITRHVPVKICTDDPFTTGMRAKGVEIMNDIKWRIENGMDGQSNG
jgi:hypothetical protein